MKANQKVLFIGLPCQVAAVNQFIKDKTNLVTADLICHGTPSPYLLKKCLQEYGHDINTLTDINFRIKSLYELNRDGKPIAAFHTILDIKKMPVDELCEAKAGIIEMFNNEFTVEKFAKNYINIISEIAASIR